MVAAAVVTTEDRSIVEQTLIIVFLSYVGIVTVEIYYYCMVD